MKVEKRTSYDSSVMPSWSFIHKYIRYTLLCRKEKAMFCRVRTPTIQEVPSTYALPEETFINVIFADYKW
ncbi:g041 [Yersinia phage phiR1-37]|uniref:hypothetical protein n=1 Tax=Yersinia phage phiR1-37 TaxID=331278 RepID=UPI00022DBCD5|nr:hypothetical protein phiR1-37_gp041 [Yersinia phage phiR1-37]CCE26065.1 g041 [Yersinia phage phiR1-37]